MARAHVEVPLSGERGRGLVTLVDVDDYEWVASRRVSIASHGYAQVFSDAREVTTLHRALVGLRKGDRREVDHSNRNKLDNRRSNLRVVTRPENGRNKPAPNGPFTRNTTRQRGGRWQAQVKHLGVNVRVGTYDTQREAWEAAEEWKRANVPNYVPQEH